MKVKKTTHKEMNSLRKHPFLVALRPWRRVGRNGCFRRLGNEATTTIEIYLFMRVIMYVSIVSDENEMVLNCRDVDVVAMAKKLGEFILNNKLQMLINRTNNK